MNAPGEIASKVLDEERKRAEEHQERIREMAKTIEEILIKNDASWQDWHQVVQSFNERNAVIVPQLKISFFKAKFEEAPTL